MRPSTRVFLLAALLIVMLACGAAYLVSTGSSEEFVRPVLTVFGGAIGAIGGACLFLGVFLRLKGR